MFRNNLIMAQLSTMDPSVKLFLILEITCQDSRRMTSYLNNLINSPDHQELVRNTARSLTDSNKLTAFMKEVERSRNTLLPKHSDISNSQVALKNFTALRNPISMNGSTLDRDLVLGISNDWDNLNKRTKLSGMEFISLLNRVSCENVMRAKL